MKVNQMTLEPNTQYKAVAESQMSPTSTLTISSITLKTDSNGEIVEFSDNILKDYSGKPIKEDINMAGIYDYLQLENVDTGRIINLKLHTAAARGDVDLANQALSENSDIELRMKQGATPLHWASAHGHLEIVRLFVEHNANINSKDDFGWTPILLAANHRHLEVVKFLKEKGAELKGVVNGEELWVSLGGSETRISNRPNDFQENKSSKSSRKNIFQKITCLFGTKRSTKTKFKQVPVSLQVESVINLTRASVGGKVRRLEVEFEDGTILEDVRLIGESKMELPIEHAGKEIAKTRIPYNQK